MLSLNYVIIPYDKKYRDDMIFMVLEAKDALGRIPRLNEDLLDIQKNYLDKGDIGPVSLEQATTQEVAQVAWMTKEQIKKLFDEGKMVHTLGYFFTTEGL